MATETEPFDYRNATEQQLRDAPKVWPKDQQELDDIRSALLDRNHDYGSSALAVTIIAEATMNYAASKLGLSGFQFSCAEMELLRRSRRLTLGGCLLDFKETLYPQYDIIGKVRESLTEAKDRIQAEAKRLVEEANDEAGKENTFPPAAQVFQHWVAIAHGHTPYIK